MGPFADQMEKIMSKTNDTSRLATLEDHRPLANSELDAVSGGWSLSGIPGAGAATTGHRALTHAVSGFFTASGTHV
jgi:hypothetical protein